MYAFLKEPAQGYDFPTKRTPIMGFHPSVSGRNTGASVTLPTSVPRVPPQKKHRHTDLPRLNVFSPKGQARGAKEGSRPGQPREEPPGLRAGRPSSVSGARQSPPRGAGNRRIRPAPRRAAEESVCRGAGAGRLRVGARALPAWTSRRPRACSAPAPGLRAAARRCHGTVLSVTAAHHPLGHGVLARSLRRRSDWSRLRTLQPRPPASRR